MRVNVLKVIILSLVTLLSACASGSRYIAAPTVPPTELGVSFKDTSVDVSLNYIIIPNGPGSWIKDARWDEYVFVVRNISNSPVTVERIRLIDPRGLYIESGVHPLQLESTSEALAGQYKDMGIAVAIDVGATAAVTGVAMAAGTVGAAAGAVVLAPLAVIAAPIYFMSRQHAGVKDMEDITREFNRRRLTAFTLSGNATVQGSIFFPIIPNPKALVVDYRMGSDMKTAELTLERLTGLHVASVKEEKK